MPFLGRWEVDDVLYFPANTHSPSTGAATDSDSVPAWRCYENDTTAPILTGTMSLLDGSNTAGLYMANITLSAANGFEVGKCYTVYVAATVGGITSTMAHTFQVEAAIASASAIVTLQADTDDIQTRLPAALVSGRMDSSVGAMAANVLTATAIATDAITAAKIAADAIGASELAADAVTEIQSGLSTLTAAGVRTAVGLATANLDTQLDALPTNAELTTALGTADDATLAAIAALNNISTAQVNTEVDTALADVGLTTTITGRIDAAISTRLASGSYTAPPTVSDILAGVIEGSITLKGALRLAMSVLTGKASGGGTATVVFRDTDDTKARITATVDSNGNRTTVTRDITD